MNRGKFLKSFAALFGVAIVNPKIVLSEVSAISPVAESSGVAFISHHAIVSRQMLQNVKFLQSWLPMQLMEEMNKAEDSDFENDLLKAAS